MVKHDIDFYPEIECDACGDIGSYDIDGEYLCVNCANNPLEMMIDGDEDYEYEEIDRYC